MRAPSSLRHRIDDDPRPNDPQFTEHLRSFLAEANRQDIDVGYFCPIGLNDVGFTPVKVMTPGRNVDSFPAGTMKMSLTTATPAAEDQRGGRFLSGTRQDPPLSPRQVAETETQYQRRRTDRQPTSALPTPAPADS